jgi:ATP-binding protein involved in chromosome partitioning
VDALIIPVERYGLKVMSVGFMNPGDKPLIWRGPMLHQIMREFMQRVDWGRWTTSSSICRPEQATSPSP